MTQPLRPFDLAKLDFEKQRQQKRHRLLKFSALPLGIILIIGLWFCAAWLSSYTTVTAINQKAYEQAVNTSAWVPTLPYIQPSLAFYNYGTSLADNGQFAPAVDQFNSALAYAHDPSEICTITRNLVLTQESLGDTALTVKQSLQDAQTAYMQALSRIQSNPTCFKDTSTQDRIQQKLNAVKEALKQKASSAGTKATQDAPTSAQQKQLDKVQQQADQSRTEGQNNSNIDTLNPDQNIKQPW